MSRPARSSWRRPLSAVVLGAALGATAACTPSAPAAIERLRVAVHSDPLSLDPHLQNEMLTFAVLANVYETLTVFDPEQRVGPLLAESWDNPDEVTWRFQLRPAQFHDGSTLDADDVVYSLERARSHPRSNLSSYLVEVDSIRALSPSSVEVKTSQPFAILLNKLAFLAIVPAGTPETITRPVGTGPFQFVESRAGDRLVLKGFDEYWNGAPKLRNLEFVTVLDAEARIDALVAGRADIARDVPPELAARLDEAPGVGAATVLGLSVMYLHLNPRHPAFADRRVREAIHLALDREALVRRELHGLARPVGQMVSPNAFGFDPGLEAPARDLGRARELLAAAGWPDGFAIDLEMRQGRRADSIAAQLGELGIEVTPVVRPWSEMFSSLVRQEVDFYYGGVMAPSADASDFLDSFAHSRTPESGYGVSNFAGYSNPEVDLMIERSATTLKMRQRKELLQAGIRAVAEDLVYVPLWVAADVYGVRHTVDWTPRMDTFMLGREMLLARPGTD